ncbi:ATP synthase subunit B [Paenibacillus montaniterrae]|uniref:ATP synthase subunit B n=1 Tax=Paenibacillus montaniterrae TaxID=429341 RepID=A0A919YMX2_9BACL|nr:hypothetical protein [Paenibacillus montaniterrae]GIP17417.1 ATP synthase subunit B [Paenibacillus montaniterrae]
MKDTIGKAVSLAFGLAALGKEQVEKVVEELVKKGEMTKDESKAWIDAVVTKGKETEALVERTAKERFSEFLKEQGLATKEEVELLKQRVEALEQAHHQQH